MPVIDLFRRAEWLTRQRVLLWSCGFLLLSGVLAAVHAVRHTALGLTAADGEQLGVDFVNYWLGARLGAVGQAAMAYDIGFFDAAQKAVMGPAAHFKMYVYPPVAMLLTQPLALLPFVWGLVAWTTAGAALCAATLSRLLGGRWAILATLAAPAAMLNVLTGQNGYFTAALLAGGLLALERRPVLAGLLFGLLSYKPHLGLLLPLALIAGGQWRAVAAAAVSVVVLAAASAAVLGLDAWTAFLHQMTVQQHVMEIGRWGWHRIPTVFVALRMAGAGAGVAYAAQAVSAVLAAAVVVGIWRARCAFGLKAATLLLATFLAAPYAQDYDMVVLVFAAAWLLRAARESGFLPWERLVLAILLVLPLVTMPLAKATGVQIGPLVLWALLVLTVRRALPLDAASARMRLASG